MKKIFRFFIFILISFVLINNVYAEEDDSGDDTVPISSSQLDTQKKAIDAYCSSNEEVPGCLYDKNNSLYTTYKARSHSVSFTNVLDNINFGDSYQTILGGDFNISSDLEVSRGYQAFDGEGNAIYAACYKYNITEKDLGENPGLDTGTIFIFTFITEKSNQCKITSTQIIPSEGMTGKNYRVVAGKYHLNDTITFDGQTNTYNGVYITFNKWKAQNNGECPKVFGYTANTKWYTSSKNKYIFSNDIEDFKIDTIAFFSNEQYTGRRGCTVEDKSGKEVAEELLKEIKKEINAYKCPSKIEDMIGLSNEFEEYYDKLREDNEFRALWSAGLIDEVTRKNSQETIRGYIKDKMTSCQYTICNISSTEKTRINNNLGSTCKNGCSLSNVNVQSDDPNAKCHCCGGSSQGCTYKWIVPSSGNTCSLQSSISYDQCIGTTKDLECRKCLETAYNAANLSEDKKSCLMSSEILKALTENDLAKINKDEADKDADEEIEDNKKIREEIFEKLIIEAPDWDLSDKPMSCAEILGPNLMKLVKFALNTLRIVGSIMAIVIGMTKLIPAVSKGDQGELNSAIKNCIWMAVVLILIIVLPILLKTIGNLFGLDVTCIP